MKKYVALKDNLGRIFLSDKIKIDSYKQRIGKNEILVENYKKFSTISINKTITIFFFSDEERPFNDFINVTQNKLYLLENVLKGSLKQTNIVIEGADGVGKSTLVAELAYKGYITQDRAVNEVTRKMREEIPKEDRIQGVKEYLEMDKNRKLVFLYLSDENVLKQRIESRKNISEYDKKALIFQRLYLDTYNELKSFSNIYIIDCLGKTPAELVKEIENLI
ncbi:MAG: hypothetical protein HFJ60_07495 [Clostridia bacterium]|jgi:thymidylate kinase|nr:hypothetical protein [Clostridia bacterium]